MAVVWNSCFCGWCIVVSCILWHNLNSSFNSASSCVRFHNLSLPRDDVSYLSDCCPGLPFYIIFLRVYVIIIHPELYVLRFYVLLLYHTQLVEYCSVRWDEAERKRDKRRQQIISQRERLCAKFYNRDDAAESSGRATIPTQLPSKFFSGNWCLGAEKNSHYPPGISSWESKYVNRLWGKLSLYIVWYTIRSNSIIITALALSS